MIVVKNKCITIMGETLSSLGYSYEGSVYTCKCCALLKKVGLCHDSALSLATCGEYHFLMQVMDGVNENTK